MDTLYLSFQNTADITFPFPSQIHIAGRGVALVDVKGEFEPRHKDETYYLCSDFVQNSYLYVPPPPQPLPLRQGGQEEEFMTVATDIQQHPILRCLPYKNISTDIPTTGGVTIKKYGGRIKEAFAKLLFLPVLPSRSPLDDIRLYIINSQGQVPSFDKFDLTCTLLFIDFHSHHS